jgi:DNA-binding CsgD family transcriptional regulator
VRVTRRRRGSCRIDRGTEPALPAVLAVEAVEIDGKQLVVFSFPTDRRTAPSLLTRAEHDVMELVLRGLSTAQIAILRGAAKATISSQLQSIYRKLGVGSRTELTSKLG